MGRLYLYVRALVVVAAAGIAGSSCSCSDRTVDEAPEVDAEPACLWLIAPRGYRADGSSAPILDHGHERTATVCLCLTQEEYDALEPRLERTRYPEPGTLLEEYNELAYEECVRLAALPGENFVDDECLEYYEAGEWLKDIYFARGDNAHGAPPDFTCDQ